MPVAIQPIVNFATRLLHSGQGAEKAASPRDQSCGHEILIEENQRESILLRQEVATLGCLNVVSLSYHM